MMKGFGFQHDLDSGINRSWYVGDDGLKRWHDNDKLVDEEKAFDENVNGGEAV